jgi:hypothetical protein
MWKTRIGWALVIVGFVCLTTAITWGALVWNDDQTRMDDATAIGLIGVAGILGLVWGVMTLGGGGGGGDTGWSDWNF